LIKNAAKIAIFADTGKFCAKTLEVMDLKHAAHLDLGFGDVLFLHGHQITVKNHEISVFPDFNAAFAAFKETAFGHPDGDGTKGLFSG
jgi:hypothetical protein